MESDTICLDQLNVLQAVFPHFWESSSGREILRQDAEDFPYPWPESYWKGLRTDEEGGSHLYYALGEELDEAPVRAWALFDQASRELVHLQKIFVSPLEQGQGLGGLFLRGCLDMWKNEFSFQNEGGEVELEVAVDNQAAVALYHQLGFDVVRQIKGFYSDGRNAYKMRYNLSHSA